jgi:hypothetical protein
MTDWRQRENTVDDTVDDEELYRRVRAGFIAQGTTLNKWCIANGVHRQAARACLLGLRKGPKAKALKARLIKASGAKTS